VAGMAYWRLVRRRAPELATLVPRLDLGLARSLLAFGGHIQTVNLGPLVVEVGAKVVLSRAVGLGAVAAYELATRVASQVGGALLAAALAVFPAVAGIHAADAGDTAALALFYRRVTRRLGAVTWGAYALLIVLAAPFATAWLGPGQPIVGWSIAVLGLGGLVAVQATPAYLVAQAGRRERISTAASLVTVAVALVAAVGLVRPWGLPGVVVGVALGLAAGGIAIWWLFARAFGTGWATVTCLGWRGPVAGLCGGVAAWAAVPILPENLAGVAAAGLVGFAVWLAVLIAVGEVGPAERALFRQVLSGGEREAA